jgi:hypothetical protein
VDRYEIPIVVVLIALNLFALFVFPVDALGLVLMVGLFGWLSVALYRRRA